MTTSSDGLLPQKQCKFCGDVKSLNAFGPEPRNKDGRQGTCRSCDSKRQRKWWKSLPAERRYAATRRARLKYNFGLTEDEYAVLAAKQGNVCAICEGVNPSGKNLFVDHDHACCPGARSCGLCIRGLLCSNCNWALGNLREDITLFHRAVDYLERTRFR